MADRPTGYQPAQGSRRGNEESAWGSVVNLGVKGWEWLMLLAAAGIVLTFFKGADGKSCGIPFNMFSPYSYARITGCFIRSVTQALPDNITTDGAQPIQPASGPELINPVR